MHYDPFDEPDVVIYRQSHVGIVASGADNSDVLARLADAAGFPIDAATGLHAITDDIPPRQAARAVTLLAGSLLDTGHSVRIDSSIPDAASPLARPDLAPIAETLAEVARAVEVTVRPHEVRELLEDLVGDDGPLTPAIDVLSRIADRCVGYHPEPHYRATEDLHRAVQRLAEALTSIHAAARRLPDPQALTRHTAPAAARPATAVTTSAATGPRR